MHGQINSSVVVFSRRVPPSQDMTRRSEILAGMALFAGLSTSEIDRLAARGRRERFDRGATIYRKGSPGGELMIVVSGIVQIAAMAPDGREVVIDLIQAGELFGLTSLLGAGDRRGHASAETPSEVMTLHRHDALAIFQKDPKIAFQVMAMMGQRLSRRFELLEDAVFLDTRARLAKTLIRLLDSAQGARIKITQQALGRMVGLSRESTNKHLARWIEAGWLSTARGALVILAPEALHAQARMAR